MINEIHADPDEQDGDANGDGVVDLYQDEFVEIINITGVAVDLSGWRLKDNVALRHVFPEGTVLPYLCAIVVFGGGNPARDFGGSLIQVASTGALYLNNYGDEVILQNPTYNDMAYATYGIEGGDNQSITRYPDLSDSVWYKHSLVSPGGALFSPGLRSDGTPFSGCR
jgi:hypothetical protein